MLLDMSSFDKIFGVTRNVEVEAQKPKEKKEPFKPKANVRVVKRVRNAIAQYNRVSKQELSIELELSAYALNAALNYLVENKLIQKEVACKRGPNNIYQYYI